VLPVIFLTGGVQAGETRRGSRPYLIVAGLALSFAFFTLLGTLLLSALHLPQDVIRWGGLTVLVLLGIGLIVPKVEELLEKPFSRIPQRRVGTSRGGFVLGLALGAVYVPCAGPVLAAITVAGATGEIGARTVVLTVAFAVGTAVPLLFFALAGRRVAERVRAFRNQQHGLRIAAGVVVIGLAVALTFNATDAIQRTVPDYTAALNNAVDSTTNVAKALGPRVSTPLFDCVADAESGNPSTGALENCGMAPAFAGISQWLNTPGDAALTVSGLKGKVVLVDFWAYSCINCQRAIAHITAWSKAYAAAGLEVVGVHTPEYAFEHVASNVVSGAHRLGITYPVALDNDYKTWNNYSNNAWPADYLIDGNGIVRDVAIGEGDYSALEKLIRELLVGANANVTLPAATDVPDATPTTQLTPETYLGTSHATDDLGQPGGFDGSSLTNGTKTFTAPQSVPDDEFALSGTWTVGDEALTAKQGSTITLNYLASDVYLDVGGTGTITATVNGKTTSYPVSGAPNIYQVLNQKTAERGTLKVTLSPGLGAYSFTFG
jgi:cytochrome c biogenesis protein CcdA/thiol-disulfide isomerase/thioredoxin